MTASDRSTTQYKVNLAKLSLAEAHRWGGPRHVALVAVWKLFAVRRYAPGLVPAETGITIVEPETLPANVLERLRAPRATAVASGFEPLFHYTSAVGGAALAAIDERSSAVCLIVVAGPSAGDHVAVSVVSRDRSHGYVVTSNGRFTFDPPPGVTVRRMPGRPVRDVIEAHARRSARIAVRPVSRDDVRPLILELQTAALRHNVRRGLYVPVS